MEGASRGALATGREQLERVLGQTDPAELGEELLFVGRTLDGSASLRRALADPSRTTEAKRALVDRLFGTKIGEQARHVVGTLVGQRWHAERDMSDALDALGAEAVLAGAERNNRLEATEDELFQLGRTVQGSSELRDALSDSRRSGADKAKLIAGLLEGKATPEAVRLAALAAANPRGQRFSHAIERYTDAAADRRRQLTALVTSAAPLDEQQTHRLASALSSMYGKPVRVNVVLDPDIIGGLRVQVGDEVIDGTISRRLDDARRAMAG